MARILIVEDEPDLGELYRITLEAEGHEVVGVYEDPGQSIADVAARAQGGAPDLVILDERVRNQSGTAFIPQFRSAFPAARILVATADPEAAATAVGRGADETKRKPFALQHLVDDVRAMLGVPIGVAPQVREKVRKREGPGSPRAHLARAQQRHDAGDVKGAVEECDEAIRLEPDNSKAYCNRAALLVLLGDHDRAIADATEAIRLDTQFAMAYYNRGLAHEKKIEVEEALADYTQAIRLDPWNADAFNNRGVVRCMKGDLDGAIQDFDDAIRLNAEDPDAHCNRGLARYRRGDLPGALADLKRALELAPAGWPHLSDVKKAVREIRKML